MYFTNKENLQYLENSHTKRANKPSEQPGYMNEMNSFYNRETKDRDFRKNSHKKPSPKEEEKANPTTEAYNKIQLLMDKLHQKISLRVSNRGLIVKYY